MSIEFSYNVEHDGKTPFTPPSKYEELRNRCPVSQVTLWDGSKVWFITRQKDNRTVLADPLLSADSRTPGFPLVAPGSESLTEETPTFARMDAPEHPRQRAFVNAEFSRKRANDLRPQIQEIVDELVDRILAKPAPADLTREFAEQIPSQVIMLILGVPREQREYFSGLADTICDHYAAPVAIEEANDKLTRLLAEVVEEKAQRPTDDLLSRLVVERERTGDLTRDDIIAMARVFLVAGFETTHNAIALSIVALFYHPDQLTALRADPALMPNAVEELLRFTSVQHTGIPRAALTDTEVAGQRIKAGEAVLAYLPSANFDPEFYDDPETLDLRRENPGSVNFGYGPHRCLGQFLARVELEVALETLLRRIPGLRLAVELDQLRFRTETSAWGLYELPVTW